MSASGYNLKQYTQVTQPIVPEPKSGQAKAQRAGSQQSAAITLPQSNGVNITIINPTTNVGGAVDANGNNATTLVSSKPDSFTNNNSNPSTTKPAEALPNGTTPVSMVPPGVNVSSSDGRIPAQTLSPTPNANTPAIPLNGGVPTNPQEQGMPNYQNPNNAYQNPQQTQQNMGNNGNTVAYQQNAGTPASGMPNATAVNTSAAAGGNPFIFPIRQGMDGAMRVENPPNAGFPPGYSPYATYNALTPLPNGGGGNPVSPAGVFMNPADPPKSNYLPSTVTYASTSPPPIGMPVPDSSQGTFASIAPPPPPAVVPQQVPAASPPPPTQQVIITPTIQVPVPAANPVASEATPAAIPAELQQPPAVVANQQQAYQSPAEALPSPWQPADFTPSQFQLNQQQASALPPAAIPVEPQQPPAMVANQQQAYQSPAEALPSPWQSADFTPSQFQPNQQQASALPPTQQTPVALPMNLPEQPNMAEQQLLDNQLNSVMGNNPQQPSELSPPSATAQPVPTDYPTTTTTTTTTPTYSQPNTQPQQGDYSPLTNFENTSTNLPLDGFIPSTDNTVALPASLPAELPVGNFTENNDTLLTPENSGGLYNPAQPFSNNNALPHQDDVSSSYSSFYPNNTYSNDGGSTTNMGIQLPPAYNQYPQQQLQRPAVAAPQQQQPQVQQQQGQNSIVPFERPAGAPPPPPAPQQQQSFNATQVTPQDVAFFQEVLKMNPETAQVAGTLPPAQIAQLLSSDKELLGTVRQIEGMLPPGTPPSALASMMPPPPQGGSAPNRPMMPPAVQPMPGQNNVVPLQRPMMPPPQQPQANYGVAPQGR